MSAAHGFDQATQPPREVLRQAVDAVHQRLHQHPLLARLGSGEMNRDEYRDFLIRYWGFHAPLEAVLLDELPAELEALEPDRRRRVPSLREDLLSLGLDAGEISRLPLATSLPDYVSPARRLGGLYVREGSTRGGRFLAKQLDSALGADAAGRTFLLGGPDENRLWDSFCSLLNQPVGVNGLAEMVEAAEASFSVFEEWISAD